MSSAVVFLVWECVLFLCLLNWREIYLLCVWKSLWVSAAGSTWSGTRGCSSSMSIKTSPLTEWGTSPTHTNTQQRKTLVVIHTWFTSPAWFLFKAHTFPFMSIVLHCLFLLRGAAIFLQGLDSALPDHGLPPELAVVNDFDDNGRHVEVLARKPLEMEVDYYDWPRHPNADWLELLSVFFL